MNKCLICGKQLDNENHFLCKEHFEKIGNYQEENYNETLKTFLESWNNIKKFKTFQKVKNEILITMNLKENAIESIIDELIQYKQAFEDFNKKITEENKQTPGFYKVPSKAIIVRSKCELAIANVLINNQIDFLYEVPISEKYNYLTDFYLPDYGIYIEYWGMSTPKYKKIQTEKIKLYNSLNLDLISLEKYDIATKNEKQITKKILNEISKIKKKKLNF